MAALEGTLKTPFGVVQKKTALIVGGGLAGILGIAWYRSKKQAQDAGATPTDATTIDPASGYAYGSPEEAAFLAQQGGYVDTSGVGAIPGYASSQPPPPAYPTPNSGPGTFTTNGAWAQYVEDYLVNQAGGDAAKVGNAVGKYITGQPVTPDQRNLIQHA